MVSIIYLYTFHCQCILALQKKQFRQNNKKIQTKTTKNIYMGEKLHIHIGKKLETKGKIVSLCKT